MSDKGKYNVESISLYLEGKLSTSQMHELEKAALHDPFLADALEGMELYADKDKFSSEVEELNARLKERLNKRKGVLLSINHLWWKIAAVLLIIITGVAVIIFTGERNKIISTEYAKTENKKEPKPAPDTPAREAVVSAQMKPDSQNQAGGKEKTKVAPPLTIQRQEESIAEKEETPLSKKSLPATVPSKDSVIKVEGLAREKNDQQANVTRALEGKVAGIDQKRSPAESNSVPSVNEAEVDDSSLQEVVIVGYGNNKNRTANRSKSLSAGQTKRRVIPGNGWEEFERYIEDSLKINSPDSLYTGEEQLTFTIGNNGLPESIKILQSISPSHDREAIRLLQNGPAWRVVKGNKRNVTLKIIF